MRRDKDLREELNQTLEGRVCLMGLGNSEQGDDGLGVWLAEELIALGVPDVLVAGTTPESFLSTATDQEFDHVVFLDAAEFGSEPGSVVFLSMEQIESRFPQVSTHKISLSVLAKFIESNEITRAWLLGVQPESTRLGASISPRVSATLDVLRDWLFRLKTKEILVC